MEFVLVRPGLADSPKLFGALLQLAGRSSRHRAAFPPLFPTVDVRRRQAVRDAPSPSSRRRGAVCVTVLIAMSWACRHLCRNTADFGFRVRQACRSSEAIGSSLVRAVITVEQVGSSHHGRGFDAGR